VHKVRLDLLVEIYQQVRRLEAVDTRDLVTAGELFEQFRGRAYGSRRGVGWDFAPRGKRTARMVSNLRYLMTCLQVANRVGSQRLRVDEAIKGQSSLRELEK
jgi:hypothetical protein